MSSFTELGVPARLDTVLDGMSITEPTPIQAATLPSALAGRDVLGRGRTGSGKTLAFVLPTVTRLAGVGSRPRTPRGLILAPTRELVAQIDAVLQPLAKAYGLTSRTVFGGVGQGPQVEALRRGVDIVVACPGRLEDLIGQGHCSLDRVEITVLDEADHMADLGFLPAVRRLLGGTPRGGQRMLFSATLDKAVDALVQRYLSDPAVHEADSAQSPVARMTHHVLQIERSNRLPIVLDLASAPGKTVVFTRTKHGARALARQLNRGGVPAVELHGNLSQNARTRNMDAFHSGRTPTLVATDIAARGIHVDEVTLVIHADPPADPKAYLHRSGRTARAGNTGTVVTLMTAEQRREVRDLTRAAGISPTTTTVASTADPVLATVAPGPRRLSAVTAPAAAQERVTPNDRAGSGRGGAQGRRRRGRRPAERGDGAGKAGRGSRSRTHRGGNAPGERGTARGGAEQKPDHSAASFSARRR